jgi:hypothetical protein
MPPRRALLLFFVLVGVLYGLLMIPWPGLLTGYRRTIARISNIFLGQLGEGRMRYEVMETPTLDKDTTVHVQNIATGSRARMSVNARRTYLSIAFAVSLILAAPIPWQRKAISLGLGLVLMVCWIEFGIWLKVAHMLSEPKFGAMVLGEGTRKFMFMVTMWTMSPVVPYIVALVVFALVTVRREDLVRLSDASGEHSSQPA